MCLVVVGCCINRGAERNGSLFAGMLLLCSVGALSARLTGSHVYLSGSEAHESILLASGLCVTGVVYYLHMLLFIRLCAKIGCIQVISSRASVVLQTWPCIVYGMLYGDDCTVFCTRLQDSIGHVQQCSCGVLHANPRGTGPIATA